MSKVQIQSAETAAFWLRLVACSALYLVGVLLADILKDDVESDLWLVTLHVASAASLFLLWAGFGLRSDRFKNFGAVLIFVTACFRAVAALDAAVVGTRLGDWPPRVYRSQADAYQSIIRGEIITDCGVVLVAIAWWLFVRNRRLRLGFIPGRDFHGSFWIVVYICGLATNLATKGFGLDFGGLQQFVLVFHFAGVVAIFVFAASQNSVLKGVVVALCAGLPLSYVSSASGMKENMIFPLVPAAYCAWMGWNKLSIRVMIILSGFFVIALLQPYVNLTRQQVWGAERRLSTSELVDMYLSTFDTSSFYRGIDGASNRLNFTNPHAYTMSVADRGFVPYEVFGGLATIFVPRLVWPDKPAFEPGIMHTVRLFGPDRAFGRVRSSTAAGFITELYLGGGVLGTVFGSLLFGALIGFLQTVVNRFAGSAGVYVHNFALFYLTIRLDETAVVYAFSGPVIFVLFLIPISRIWDVFKSRSAASRARAGPSSPSFRHSSP